MKNKVIIIGAGGHGKVVAEMLLLSGNYQLSGFVDDQLPFGTVVMDGYKVIGQCEQLETLEYDYFVVAIGNNVIRKGIFEKLRNNHYALTLIHPFTHVSPHARIDEGCVILPGTVISYGAIIMENCIIGSHVHIDHETIVGAHSHIRNGSAIGSNCTLESMINTATGFSLSSFSHLKAE